MGRQWSAGKLVLILDAVHWNPEAPPRTRPRVRLRCGKAPPCCASSQLRRVSLVILIKPLLRCLAFQLVDAFFSPRSMKKKEARKRKARHKAFEPPLASTEPEAKRYAGAGGREKKGLRREKLRFPMLLHAQRDAPTSGCFTPNPTLFRDGA